MHYKELGQFVGLILFVVCISHLFVNDVEGVKPCRIGNCASCTNSSACDQCNFGFGQDDKKGCKACSTISGCVQCTSVSPANCTKCKAANHAVAADGTCQTCATNCKVCPKNGPGKCDVCSIGYSVDSTKTCQACQVAHCAVCNSGPTTCSFCQSGYSPVGTTSCVQCDSYCTFCSINPPKCNPGSCQGNYGINNATEACEKCTDRNCYNCDFDISKCKTCIPGTNYSSSTSKCD